MATCSCGENLISQIAAQCDKCGKQRSHKECYPEQYAHPLVGKKVRVKDGVRKGSDAIGVVLRVVNSRFGPLAHLDTSGDTAYLVSHCKTTNDLDESDGSVKAYREQLDSSLPCAVGKSSAEISAQRAQEKCD